MREDDARSNPGQEPEVKVGPKSFKSLISRADPGALICLTNATSLLRR